jgi:hypothetical protein
MEETGRWRHVERQRKRNGIKQKKWKKEEERQRVISNEFRIEEMKESRKKLRLRLNLVL